MKKIRKQRLKSQKLYNGSILSNSCKSGKKCYTSKNAAKYVLTSLSKHMSEERDECRIYKCHECKYYHLTSKSKQSRSLASTTVENEQSAKPPLSWRAIINLLDSIEDSFLDDVELFLRVHHSIHEFKIYGKNSRPEALAIVGEIISIFDEEGWNSYREHYLTNPQS